MKFSVLLPTRNGGPFLEYCIRSILDQDYSDMELIISDNANTDETPQVLLKFMGDPRVKVVRLNAPVSVTENWNNALLASSGDYILMMGDDDYLLPGYFQWMERLLERHKQPDCVIHNAYSFVAPAAIDGYPESHYGESHFRFGHDFSGETVLPLEQRVSIVRDMFRFKVRIPLNMQTSLIGRSAFVTVCGGVFKPPFPDHYALNALLLTAERWVFSPEKPLIVGVSPKSFGHYVYSNRQGNGLSYLGIDVDFKGRLPGSELLNGMHAWLNLLKEDYGNLLNRVEVDRAGYVRRQFYAWYMQKKSGAINLRAFLSHLCLLSFSDWIGLISSVADKSSWERFIRILFRGYKKDDIQHLWHGLKPLPEIRNIQQFGVWITAMKAAKG